jgi:predicted ester cyclase
MSNAHQIVAAYWAAAEARDWDTLAGLVSEQVVYQVPQTREEVTGRAAYARFNAEGFPGEWHIEVERIVGEGQQAASWVRFRDAGGSQPGLCFFELDEDGLIGRITDFWPEPYQPPAGRAHLTGRY